MTDKVPIEPNDEEGDAWLNAYPACNRVMLERLGVPTWMHQQADAHNRRLIAAADAGSIDEAELAALAEQSFNEHFGGMLAEWAEKAASAANEGDPVVRHVDLDALQQASIANGIGHIMTRFRKREVAAIAGFTIDSRGGVRIFGGGKTTEENLSCGAAYLRAVLSGSTPSETAGTPHAASVSPGFVHTRDRREQQQAVARAMRDVRHRHRDGEIQMIVGVTIDRLGRVRAFGGGEADGRLVEAVVDEIREFIGRAEKRYDH